MRVLIISAAILACACGRPSGLIGPIAPIAQIAPITYAVNSGDIAAAATDAQVKAIDAQREWTEKAINAQNDQARELVDQAKEINAERFWNAEDQKWQTYDAIKTAESAVDGASAELSPTLAKSLVGPAVAVAQPFAVAQQYAAVAQPFAVAPTYAAAPAVAVAQPVAYSAVVQPETKTIVTQSLSQTHPAPATYVAEPIVKAAPIIETPVVAPAFEAVPAQKTIIEAQIVPKIEVAAPAQQTVVTQSLSQTHPAPAPVLKYAEQIYQPAPVLKYAEQIYQPAPILKYAEPIVQYAQPAVTTVVQPETKSVVTSSLSQTHGSPAVASGYYSAPVAYSAPVYNPEIVASAW